MAKVFLTAGHGGSDPGALGYGLKEKDINLNILLACRDELKKHGVKVVCSRTKDENDPVQQETEEANNSGADIAVSFHTNAAGGNGSETYYYTSNKDGKRLAELCEKHTKAIGQNSRGIKSGDRLYFVRNTKMTAVLCECAFIDNDTDNDIIDTVSEQRKFGVAYAKAILEFLGIEYKVAETVKVESKPEVKPEVKEEPTTTGEFKVRVNITNLRIRKGPGTNHDVTGKFTGKGVFTITQTKDGEGSEAGWGKLKSGAGWISLDYAEKLK